jgi:uncharacterized protein with HEPN domain
VAKEIPEIEKIVGFRNIIAHGYDIVDSEIVWETIKLYVPKLVKNIEEKI